MKERKPTLKKFSFSASSSSVSLPRRPPTAPAGFTPLAVPVMSSVVLPKLRAGIDILNKQPNQHKQQLVHENMNKRHDDIEDLSCFCKISFTSVENKHFNKLQQVEIVNLNKE